MPPARTGRRRFPKVERPPYCAPVQWHENLPPRPPVIRAPWASVYVLDEGLYTDPATGAAMSYGALVDRIARHRESGRPEWRVTPGGRRWLPAGARVGVVWPAWRGGHLSLSDPGGSWLIENTSFDLALRSVERWASEQGPGTPGDEHAVIERLDRQR